MPEPTAPPVGGFRSAARRRKPCATRSRTGRAARKRRSGRPVHLAPVDEVRLRGLGSGGSASGRPPPPRAARSGLPACPGCSASTSAPRRAAVSVSRSGVVSPSVRSRAGASAGCPRSSVQAWNSSRIHVARPSKRPNCPSAKRPAAATAPRSSGLGPPAAPREDQRPVGVGHDEARRPEVAERVRHTAPRDDRARAAPGAHGQRWPPPARQGL